MSIDITIWDYLRRNALKLPGTQWTLVGSSVAARRTALYIPELGIAFDCGFSTEIRLTAIFLSHCHFDHVRELPSFFLNKPDNSPPISVILPGVSTEFVVSYVTSAIQMTKMKKQNSPPNWKLLPAYIQNDPVVPSYLQEPLIINNIKFLVELFKCSHSVACTGYGLIEIRTKLREQFKNSDGTVDQNKINDLKKQGIAICEEQGYPHVCFLGDTDHRVFYTDKTCTQFEQRLEKYRTIIVECTFLEDEKGKMAKEKKHMLWKHLRHYVEAHPNIMFVLCHFSMCYTPAQIIDFFKKEKLPNVVPLVNDFDIVPKSVTSAPIGILPPAPIDADECDSFCSDTAE